MTPDEILALVPTRGKTGLKHGRLLHHLVTKHGLRTILELTAVPSLSTVYLAGALAELGAGAITSVIQNGGPADGFSADEALRRTDLASFAEVYVEHGSHHWRLLKLLERELFEHFDFCILHGGTTWPEAGFSFCLLEKLLKPGGFLLLDNLYFAFSYAEGGPRPKRVPREELDTPQVERVAELLLQSSPYFMEFGKKGQAVWARKRGPVWPREARLETAKEVLLAEVIERARCEPEFRAELLHDSRAALSAHMPPDFLNSFERAHFVDSDREESEIVGAESNGTTVYLSRPTWDRRTTEWDLARMLNE